MRIIPAIDIIEGKCVRLSQGDYNTKKIYNESPLEVAKEFEASGIKYLHLVDLDGAKSNGIVNWKILNEIATKTNLIIDFGGGLKTDKDLQIAFENGANQITGGSIAVKKPEIFSSWIEKYGSDKIILGADVKEENIAVSGWKEKTNQNIFEFLEGYINKGIKYVISTDISKDGMLNGTANELYQNIRDKFPELNVIASGGFSAIQDLDNLYKIGVEGIIIGKAIYENKITLKEIELYVD